MPPSAATRRIPSTWTDQDRKLYIGIGKRKKSEHVAAYTTVAIGCQLFYGLAKKRDKRVAGARLGEEDGGSCASASADDENNNVRANRTDSHGGSDDGVA